MATAEPMLMPTQSGEPKLCYVDGEWAWFTTQELSKQWGDDWNDAPYEHNAGTPYPPTQNEPEPWKIFKARWSANLREPQFGQLNSEYSVENINELAIPWLMGKGVVIWAGTSYGEFCAVVRSAKGIVGELEEVKV